MKIVITGAAGFIGANLCRHLTQSRPDIEVHGLDDLSSGSAANLHGVDVGLTVGSILDDAVLERTIRGASAIVHLAARPSVARSIEDPSATHEVNATGTLRVLEAARRLTDPMVIVASSSSVYGASPVLPRSETSVPMPMSPYAVSKLATEQYALAWQHSFGLRTLALRFFNVYGPFQSVGHPYAAVVPTFVHAALVGAPVTIDGDGLQTRDFTDVASVCTVIERAIERRVSHPTPVNLAFGTSTTVLELLATIEELTGTPIERRHGPSRAADVVHSQADGTVLGTLFPEVGPTELRTGLERTIEWMRCQDGVF